MTILITGGHGALGTELRKQFPESICPSRQELDVINYESVLDFLKKYNIDMVIHCAAITSIRQCDDNKSLAWNTNVEGTRNIVKVIENIDKNIKFIYISTACVFRGDESMYTEESVPYPVNFYAITKLVAENIVQSLEHYLIVRTNFVAKKKWPYPKAFTDRYGTYLFAADVAYGIKEAYQNGMERIIHITGDKVLSMYELAKMTTDKIEPMTISEYHGPHLTMNMTLNSTRWKKYKIGSVPI